MGSKPFLQIIIIANNAEWVYCTVIMIHVYSHDIVQIVDVDLLSVKSRGHT